MNSQPTVVAVDRQADLDLDVERWRSLAVAALQDEGVHGANAELSLMFVDEAEMAELNVTHMGHEGPTDVLSFPLDAAPNTAATEAVHTILLGDIVVCPAVARRNAPSHAGTFEDEMALLIVHGVLHVMGMDHAEPEEEREMQARERAVLSRHHR